MIYSVVVATNFETYVKALDVLDDNDDDDDDDDGLLIILSKENNFRK